MKRLLLCLVLGLCTAAVAQGSHRNAPPDMPRDGMDRSCPLGPTEMMTPRVWWRDSAVAKELKLSDQQLTQLESTFAENRIKLIDLRASLEKEEVRLEPLLAGDVLDEAQISSQLDAVIAARGRLEKANVLMYVAMRKILTPEQSKQLRQMYPMWEPETVGDRYHERHGRQGMKQQRPREQPKPPVSK